MPSIQVVVLGGGPAAIEAAKTASLYTEHVTVISDKGAGE